MLITTVTFLFLLSGALAVYLKQSSVPRTIWRISFIAFGIRISYILVDSALGIYAGGGDQYAYDATFWFIAEQWRSGVFLAPLRYGLSPGNSADYMLLYSAMFSPPYVIFGHISLLPRLQMALFGTLTVVNIYLITERVYDHCSGVIAAVIASIFPYWIVLSGIIYRDMLVIFFLTLMVYYFVQWQAGERQKLFLALSIVTAVLGLHLRLVNIIAVGAMVAIAVFVRLDEKLARYLGTFSSGLFAGIAAYLSFGSYLVVDRLASRRLWLARENPGAYLTGFAYESYLELFAFAPIGAIYFALTPFPWHVIDLLAMIAIAQNVFLWYPILLLSVIGLRDVLHVTAGPRMILPLLGFSFAGIFAYGLVEGNIGPAMRHRSQFQFIFFVLAAVAVANRVQVKGLPRNRDYFRQ
jgi:4-amino-4-deoxy-L-arabinose transferase-like glycosyltransferase